jgi:signal transduction histidine kinase
VRRSITLSSQRVIALGRLLLALLFLLLTWLDAYKVPDYPTNNFVIFGVYALFAAVLAGLTWNNWWLDSQLAGLSHTIDIALFTLLVSLTKGDNNPFFTFSIFIFLSAALRWGWRATALTAALLSLLFILAGLFPASAHLQFRFTDYMAGAGQLIILSLIIIWFGANQWRIGDPEIEVEARPTSLKRESLERGLRAAMRNAHASAGALVWTSRRTGRATSVVVRKGEASFSEERLRPHSERTAFPFLYDLAANRALMREPNGNLRALGAEELIPVDDRSGFQLVEGLAIPIATERGDGLLYLERVRGLSTDHLEFSRQISASVATLIQRQALMRAAEESAESRSRLAIARDLHDSVVQFLAGAAFRLEAVKRSQATGRDLTAELDELKELMLQEQGELRSFITALRSGTQMELIDLAKDLQLLANRLSRQWDIQCTFSAQPGEMAVPTRLMLDAQQLVREAVANAVRHAGAKNISIRLAGGAEEVRLDLINDGSAYPRSVGGQRMPQSLKERVEAAGGAMELSRGMGVTKVSISLPTMGKAA